MLERFHFLRQQANREGSEPCRSLADFIAPKETGLARSHRGFRGDQRDRPEGVVRRFRAENDDYNAIMAEAIADRLAEAFAECLHKRVRDEWGYGCARRPEQRGSDPGEISRHPAGARVIPPARITPRKGTLWRLLDVEANTGMLITESFAMWPGSSVSGLYFAHPESRYFSLGKIDRDQVVDYHERKGMSVAEVERWLGPNLNYDPAV